MSFVPVDLAQEEQDAIHAKKSKKNSFINITDDEDVAKPRGDDNNNNNNNTDNHYDLPDRIATSIYNYLIERVGIVVSSNLHELIKTGEIPMATLTEPFTRQELYPELYANLDDEAVQEILDQYETEVPPGSQFARRQERKKEVLLHNNNKKRQFVAVSSSDPSVTEEGNPKKVATEAIAAAAASAETTLAVSLPTTSSSLVPPSSSTTTTTTLPLLDTALGDSSSTADIIIKTNTTAPSVVAAAVVLATPTMQTRQTTNHLDIWGRVPPKEPKQNVECRICGRMVSASKFAPHLDRCMGLSLSRNGGGSGNSGGGA
jgi:Sgf11 (transcriptional regulation protein)